jgi:monothiol glutaredoxin
MSESAGARDRISTLVESNPVMLFMKGTPAMPQCGFSAQVLAILDHLSAGYATFDVLGDPEVREGIKEYSSWPTIPQLYIHGEFVGGCDIVREMYESGELQRALAGSEARASS